MTTRSLLARFLLVGLTSFGAARWTHLYDRFVRPGLIAEDDFMRDLAITQTLPGPGFVNLTAHCGMRLGGWPMAIAATALVLLPGLVAIVAALALLSGDEPWVGGFFHGILIGAVAVLAASFMRLAAVRLRGASEIALALATLLLVVAGVPLVAVVAALLVAGAWWYHATAPAG